MTRNMIQSNQVIFRGLDDFCVIHGDPIRNAGSGRWIATDANDRIVLKNSILKDVLEFSPFRKLALFEHGKRSIFVTIGLSKPKLSGFHEIDVDAGIFTAALAELKPASRASTSEIRNIIEISNKGEAEYKGHDANLIAELFPLLKAFVVEDLEPSESWRVFFKLCLSEYLAGEGRLNSALGDELEALSDLGPAAVPYKTLCRSIFDADPGALFLALYRCLEAIYSYTSAMKVKNALQLQHSWSELAVVLEDELGWHPHEETSLTSLMRHGLDLDLLAIMTALDEPVPDNADLPALVARKIYRLRNSLVHYRPAQHTLNYADINWGPLCAALASMVCFTYDKVVNSAD